MSLLSDLRVLYHMVLSPVRGGTHKDRLESFYAGQAGDYDSFRKRLLQGREALWKELPDAPGGVWVDMGAGTGANIEFFGDRLKTLKKVYAVDLSPSLLEVMSRRIKDRGWTNVEPVEADATLWMPPQGQADVVTFSYSLTMIPDWFAAIDRAYAMLKPGGIIGVVDFYVSRKWASEGRQQHGWMTRTWWPTWFSSDNVYPSPDHLPYLSWRFQQQHCNELRARLPYLPLSRMPYYIFVGKKPLDAPVSPISNGKTASATEPAPSGACP